METETSGYCNFLGKNGYKIISSWQEDGYQGSWGAILEKDGKRGEITFSFGSCSGCDALQACNNDSDEQILLKELESNIKWQDNG